MRWCLASLVAFALFTLTVAADETKTIKLNERLRKAVKTKVGEVYVPLARKEEWRPQETAIIVCDMWDAHHCYMAVKRVEEMAPRMNQVLEKARAQGVLIIHAPSDCMKTYEGHPARKRAQAAAKAKDL